jgi:hypothetical protein
VAQVVGAGDAGEGGVGREPNHGFGALFGGEQGPSDEIAELALLMAAGLGPNLTGADVVVDGGASFDM